MCLYLLRKVYSHLVSTDSNFIPQRHTNFIMFAKLAATLVVALSAFSTGVVAAPTFAGISKLGM
jgi:hypothetical protein